MTQEDRELLLKDLCSRLPYGVKCQYSHIQYICIESLIHITKNGMCNLNGHIKDICDIKPYLLPLAGMTHEQKEKYCQLRDKIFFNNNKVIPQKDVAEYVNFFYENHLDFNGLIPLGLAIDATGLDIYINI